MNPNTHIDAFSGLETTLPASGRYYRHFKGIVVKVLCIARNTETGQQLVIYQDNKGNEPWARPLEMFMSEVDKTKYPDCKQQYRFELMEENEDAAEMEL